MKAWLGYLFTVRSVSILRFVHGTSWQFLHHYMLPFNDPFVTPMKICNVRQYCKGARWIQKHKAKDLVLLCPVDYFFFFFLWSRVQNIVLEEEKWGFVHCSSNLPHKEGARSDYSSAVAASLAFVTADSMWPLSGGNVDCENGPLIVMWYTCAVAWGWTVKVDHELWCGTHVQWHEAQVWKWTIMMWWTYTCAVPWGWRVKVDH